MFTGTGNAPRPQFDRLQRAANSEKNRYRISSDDLWRVRGDYLDQCAWLEKYLTANCGGIRLAALASRADPNWSVTVRNAWSEVAVLEAAWRKAHRRQQLELRLAVGAGREPENALVFCSP